MGDKLLPSSLVVYSVPVYITPTTHTNTGTVLLASGTLTCAVLCAVFINKLDTVPVECFYHVMQLPVCLLHM